MGTDAPCPGQERVVEMEGASECMHREPFGRDQVRFLPVGSDAHVSTFPLVPIHRPSRHHHRVQDDGPIPACPIPTSMEKKLPIPPPTDPSVLSRGVGGDPPACPCDAARKHRFEDRCRSSSKRIRHLWQERRLLNETKVVKRRRKRGRGSGRSGS